MSTMTEREMLEYAAKAAGVLTKSWYGNHAYIDGMLSRWNPLTDDGDVFRLLCFVMHWAGQNVCDWEGMSFDMKCAWEELDDALASGDAERCRRAVTRLAAEIGRRMK